MAVHRSAAGRGASSTAAGLHRHHRPRVSTPDELARFAGGQDPQEVAAAASRLAHALVAGGRDHEDPEVVARLVGLVQEVGIDTLAELWSDAPPVSLAGALWRLYALHEATLRDGERWAAWFRAGREAQVSRAVAGVVEPPGPAELARMTTTVLTGAYRSDLDAALTRAAAYARVVALGQVHHAEGLEAASPDRARRLTVQAERLLSTAEHLEQAGRAWRDGSLD
ncbi:hypothetical protein [Micrococcus cohnii]|uniref:Thymidine phosphorylase n=1 Tax=Micrococcus cohnii TaxID=993416 RepID=A0A7W7M499_9MICC|nr:hypothetical protein [Micrococcus cohnii]MBB4736368.1 hypothetical protein [Micrococcus cohnii]